MIYIIIWLYVTGFIMCYMEAMQEPKGVDGLLISIFWPVVITYTTIRFLKIKLIKWVNRQS